MTAFNISVSRATFLLDRHSTVITDGFLHRPSEEMDSALEGKGIHIDSGKMVPIDAEHRTAWLTSLQILQASDGFKLTVVRSAPSLQCVLLSCINESDNILVRIPKRSVCDPEIINELSNVLRISSREQEVLSLLGHGHDPKMIASFLGTKVSTVRSQLKSIYLKTGTNSVRELLVLLSGLSHSKAGVG